MHVIATIREITGQIYVDKEIRVEESPDSVFPFFPIFIAKRVKTHVRGLDPALKIGSVLDQFYDKVGLREMRADNAVLRSFKCTEVDDKESLSFAWFLDQVRSR